MNFLLALLFSFLLLIGGKTVENKTEERVLAYIEIVQIGEGIYVRTTYDSRVFDDECSPKQVVAKDFVKSCTDTTYMTKKTKKL